MPDRTFLPTDDDVIETARRVGYPPEYVADAMNSPLADRAEHSIESTVDKAEIEAVCDAVLERTVTTFGASILDAMLEGYKLGFRHGVRSLASADPATGLMEVIRRAAAANRPPSDVRPHVPYADPDADGRLHLIADGVTACGVPATAPGRHGTHDPAEADCRDCAAALQRGGDEAGLPPVDGQAAGLVQRAAAGAAHGDLGAAEELAHVMHPSLFADEDEDEPQFLSGDGQGFVAGARPPTVEVAVHAPGDPDETACGIHYADTGLGLTLAVNRGQVTCSPCSEALDAGKGRLATVPRRAGNVLRSGDTMVITGTYNPETNETTDEHRLVIPVGWDRIEGGGENAGHAATEGAEETLCGRPLTVAHLILPPQPSKHEFDLIGCEACAGAASGILVDTVIGRSLDGELIDMTGPVVRYAHDNKLRWWQCRHCGRGRVMGAFASTTSRDERAELADHEQDCDHKGAAVDA